MSSLWLCSLITSSLAACERVSDVFYLVSTCSKEIQTLYLCADVTTVTVHPACFINQFPLSVFQQLSSPPSLCSGFPYPLSPLPLARLSLANKQCWRSGLMAVGVRHLNLLLFHEPNLFSPPFSCCSPSLSMLLSLWALWPDASMCFLPKPLTAPVWKIFSRPVSEMGHWRENAGGPKLKINLFMWMWVYNGRYSYCMYSVLKDDHLTVSFRRFLNLLRQRCAITVCETKVLWFLF